MFGLIYTLLRGELGSSVGSFFFRLDLLTVLVAYVFLVFGSTTAGAFALSQGVCMDLFSQGRPGLFALVYLSAVAVIALCRRIFELENARGQFIICAAAECFVHAVRTVMVTILSPLHAPGAQSLLNSALISATITGLAGPLCFLLFERATTVLSGSSIGEQTTRYE